jgi:hypothetical protein
MKCDINKCKSWCCKGFFIKIEIKDNEMKKYLEYHNVEIIKGRLVIPLRCKYLDENGKCKIYYSRKRPKMCKEEFCHDSLSLEEEAEKLGWFDEGNKSK